MGRPLDRKTEPIRNWLARRGNSAVSAQTEQKPSVRSFLAFAPNTDSTERPTMAKVAFKQADVSRALKGAVSAGLKPSRAEIDVAGRIVIVFDETPREPATDFDRWKAAHARSA